MYSNVNICVQRMAANVLHSKWGVFMSDIQLNSVLVGKAISKARQNSGLADIGRTHLSAIERGERKPTLETLWRISMALDMRPNELVSKIEYEIENGC